MFFIFTDIWTFITVKLIWGTLKLAWFLTQTALWLVVLLITSVVLMVRKRSWPDRIPPPRGSSPETDRTITGATMGLAGCIRPSGTTR